MFPVQRLKSIFRVLWMGLILIPFYAEAHCPHPYSQQPALAAPTPAPSLSAIAKELQEHHRYLFSEEQLAQLDQANASYAAAELSQSEQGDTKHIEGSKQLLGMLEGHPHFIDVDLSIPGIALMKGAKSLSTPGDSMAVVFRIHNGDGETLCSLAGWDMKQIWEGQPHERVPYVAGGTTYALMNLLTIPSGKSEISVFFAPTDASVGSSQGLLTLNAPKTGLLDFQLQDENEKDTPAMVRLISHYDNRERVPGGALDFSEQLERGGAPPPAFYRTDARFPYFVGPYFQKYFHIVSGSFEMGLPPGGYDAVVYRGVEYVPVETHFTVRSGEKTVVSVQTKRWIHMAKRGWFSGDGHVHASVMNDHDAKQMITFTKATDTNVSNLLCMGDHRRTWFQQRGYGPDFRVQDGNFLLVPGQEGPRFALGHAVGLNLRELVRDTDHYMMNNLVAEKINSDGGLYGFAHINAPLFNVDRDMTMLMAQGLGDFGEILQFSYLGTDLYYEYLDLGFPLTAMAGSDTPYGGCIGDVRVYAYTGKKTLDADEWFDAVEKGRTFVSNGPMVDLRVDGHRPGETIKINTSKTLKITAQTWGMAGTSAPRSVEVIAHGETIKSVTNNDPSQGSVAIEYELDVEYGTWIALKVTGHDGSVAHTTPVYVEREGFRFWNTDRVPQLIAARYATLDGMQAQVEQTQLAFSRNELSPIDHYGRNMVKGAGELLESIERVRQWYQKLEVRYVDELKKRGG